ncbi:MAG: PTS glucose transporter subunit IIA, partial [Clostridia bacterium]|nr:PTS glucose transporter subunit IIA [Clostridia bacterium]
SPLSGKTVELSDVNDPTFAEKILGDGGAIIPINGKLCSPLDGVIESIAETSHAIAISGDNGTEVLMHIGIDTVELKGEGFSVKVSVGERVKAGDVLIDFDIDIIKSAGYETVTPIIITNSDNYSRISSAKGAVSVGDELLELTE